MEGRVDPRHQRSRALLVGTILPICSLLVVIGPDVFPLMNIRAFLFPGGLLLFLFGVWYGVKKRTGCGMGALAAGLIALLPPLLVLRDARVPELGAEFLKVAQMNVQQENRSFPAVIATIRACGADLVSIQEVDTPWKEALNIGLADMYPYQVVSIRGDHYGIALFSRVPLEGAEVFDLLGLPAIRTVVKSKGQRAIVLAVHLRSPEGNADLQQRNAQWSRLGQLVASSDNPVILLGDFNAVPWDDAFRRFQKATSLTFGPRILSPTWPSYCGLALVRLDHILVSSHFSMQDGRTFEIPGSDHRGLAAGVMVGRGADEGPNR